MMGPCTCEAGAGGKGGGGAGLLSQDKRGKSWDSIAYDCRERKHASSRLLFFVRRMVTR